MSIRRELLPFERDYVQIPNLWMRDTRLSRRARGLLAELMTHRVGYAITFASIVRGGPEGKDAMRAAVDELRDAGYLALEQDRDQGRFGEVQYVLTDPARTADQPPTPGANGTPDRADNPPQSDLPLPGKPLPGNPPPKNTSEKNTIDVLRTSTAPVDEPQSLDVEVPTHADELLQAIRAERALALQVKPARGPISKASRAGARALEGVDPAHLRLVLRWAFTESGDPWWIRGLTDLSGVARNWERLEGRYLAESAAATPPAPAVVDDHAAMLKALEWSPYDWETSTETERVNARRRAIENGWRPTRSAAARPSA